MTDTIATLTVHGLPEDIQQGPSETIQTALPLRPSGVGESTFRFIGPVTKNDEFKK